MPGQEGAASVATLLATVSQDGERAVLVSFPPTAMVDTPECRAADGDLREPRTEAFAGSLLEGGPSCMVRAVQQLSGLQVDHYLELDLARLPDMVDALGGVPVCIAPSRAPRRRPAAAGRGLEAVRRRGRRLAAARRRAPTTPARRRRADPAAADLHAAGGDVAGTLADPVALARS